MVQTSAKKLSSRKENQVFDRLVTLLADIDHPTQMGDFLELFLTDSEQSVLSKRFAILWLLHQRKSYEEIKDELHVSSATISSVSDLLDNDTLHTVLKTVEKDQKIDKLVQKIAKLTRLGKN